MGRRGLQARTFPHWPWASLTLRPSGCWCSIVKLAVRPLQFALGKQVSSQDVHNYYREDSSISLKEELQHQQRLGTCCQCRFSGPAGLADADTLGCLLPSPGDLDAWWSLNTAEGGCETPSLPRQPRSSHAQPAAKFCCVPSSCLRLQAYLIPGATSLGWSTVLTEAGQVLWKGRSLTAQGGVSRREAGRKHLTTCPPSRSLLQVL